MSYRKTLKALEKSEIKECGVEYYLRDDSSMQPCCTIGVAMVAAGHHGDAVGKYFAIVELGLSELEFSSVTKENDDFVGDEAARYAHMLEWLRARVAEEVQA